MIDAVYRAESRCVLATLIRLLGGVELAEEALHEAFAAAVEHSSRGSRRHAEVRHGGPARLAVIQRFGGEMNLNETHVHTVAVDGVLSRIPPSR